MQVVLLRTDKGELTFTFDNDDRLNGVFKEWEQIGVINNLQHQEILRIINSCEWDKVIDIDSNLNVIKKDKYTPQEREAILLEKTKEEEKAFFEKEKTIALAIKADYDLKLEPITDAQMAEVMEYVGSIKPTNELVLKSIVMELPRPVLMGVYEKRLGLS